MRMFSAPQLSASALQGPAAWAASQTRSPWPSTLSPSPEGQPGPLDSWGGVPQTPLLAGFGLSASPGPMLGPTAGARGMSPAARPHGGLAAEGPLLTAAQSQTAQSPRRLPTPSPLSARLPHQAPGHLDAAPVYRSGTPSATPLTLGPSGPSTGTLGIAGTLGTAGPSIETLLGVREMEDMRLRRRSASSRPTLQPQPNAHRQQSPMIEVRHTPHRAFRSLTPPKLRQTLRQASPAQTPRTSFRNYRGTSPAPHQVGPHFPVPHRIASPAPVHAQVIRPLKPNEFEPKMPKVFDHSPGEYRDSSALPMRTPRKSLDGGLESSVSHSSLGLKNSATPAAPAASQADPSPPPPEEDLQDELAEGAKVQIGETICRITAPLGMGSFGVVWAAECADIEGEVAVKEILCQSQTDLARAVYEAQLLWMLGAHAPLAGQHRSTSSLLRGSRDSLGPVRIPAYVASDMAQAGEPEVCRVRLAMTRIPGEPLDRHLRDRRQQLDVVLSEMSEDRLPEALLRQITEAYRFSRELIMQLAPTMDKIATLSYHRDVNAHNILIAEADSPGATPQYGLVDFGLAVDATRWRGGEKADAQGTGDWQHLDVGGDCRYWPASAWLQFEVGCYELANAVSLCLEYQTHLDLQGLGITAMQVFIEMMPIAEKGDDIEEGAGKLVPKEIWRLGAIWDEYWDAATRFWTALLDTFRNNGDWNVLKNEFIQIGVHDVVGRKLEDLRTALVEAEEACKRLPPSHSLHEAEALFSSLLVLISSGEERSGTTLWDEVLAPFKRGKSGGGSVLSTRMPSASSLQEQPCSVSTHSPFPGTGSAHSPFAGTGSSLVQAEAIQGLSSDQSHWLPPPTQIPKGVTQAYEPRPAVIMRQSASPAPSPARQLPQSPPQTSPRVIHRDATGTSPPGSPQPQPRIRSPHGSPTRVAPNSSSPTRAVRVINRMTTSPSRASTETVRRTSTLTTGPATGISSEQRAAVPASARSGSPNTPSVAAQRGVVSDAGYLSPRSQLRLLSPSASSRQTHQASPRQTVRVLSPQRVASPSAVPRSPSSRLATSPSKVDASTATRLISAPSPLTPDFTSGGESRDLFLRLSNLANKVVQLASAMETLELRDRDLAEAAARRMTGGVEVTGVGLRNVKPGIVIKNPLPSVAAI